MNVLTLIRKELAGYFLSPLAWVILTMFLLVQGYSFYLLMVLVTQPNAPHGAVMQFFFGGTVMYWLFMIFVVSTITMRLIAEERARGTIEALLTAPISEAEVILGKYLAAVAFYAFLWLPTASYVVMLRRLTGSEALDLGPVLSAYLGTLLVGAACIAVGLLASSLTRSQIVAATITFALLSVLLLSGPLELYVERPALRDLLRYVNLFDHMEDFARGIVDSRQLVFYGSIIVFCLFAATKALEVKKWR